MAIGSGTGCSEAHGTVAARTVAGPESKSFSRLLTDWNLPQAMPF
jgi:hypothetical protein